MKERTSLTRAWLLLPALLAVAVGAALALSPSASAEHTTGTNDIYDLFVDHDTSSDGVGTYTAGTGPSHPVTIEQGGRQNVLYAGDDGDAWSSYTTVRSYTSATDYVQTTGGPSSSNTVINLDPFATSADLGTTGFQTTYDLQGGAGGGPAGGPTDDLLITQVWRVNGTTLNNSVVELTTTVENTGSTNVDVGIRHEWDIQMSCDDGPSFTPIDASGDPVGSTITTEQTFPDPSFPAYRVEDNECTGSPLLAVFGTAGPSALQPEPTTPELLMYTNWDDAYDSAFDYTTDPSDTSPDGDSAVLYFYGATPNTAIQLSPGGSVSVTAELFAGVAGEPPPVFDTPTATAEATDTPVPGQPTATSTPVSTQAPAALPDTGGGAGGSSMPDGVWAIAALAAIAGLAGIAGAWRLRRSAP